MTDTQSFRRLPEENLVSAEQIAQLGKIMTLPIEEAEELTEDELCEDIYLALDA